MKEHYRPFLDRHDFYVFTSPLGRHGPFGTIVFANRAAASVEDNHRTRAKRDGAEATLLREYFKPTPTKA